MDVNVSRPMITTPSETEVTLASLLAVVRRRRGMLLATVTICFLLGVLACAFSTRRYKAEGLIEIEKSSNDMLGASSMMPNSTDTAWMPLTPTSIWRRKAKSCNQTHWR